MLFVARKSAAKRKLHFVAWQLAQTLEKKKTCLPILFFFIQLLQNVKLINSLGRRDQIWVFLL